VTRIVLADDHAVVRRGLRQILAESFPRIVIGEAADAVEALRLVLSSPWDVVILDLSLGGGRSGLDVLKDIRRRRPGLPVLILSIQPEGQYARRALRAGAAGYLTKEAAPEELVKAVRKVLKGGRYVSAAFAEKMAGDIGSSRTEAPHEKLSDREDQVLRLIASGRSSGEIAGALGLSVKTVTTYRARLIEKLGVHSTAELTRYALEHGLID
jgi:DNA-binding NarL/FixJ family response regulator